MRSLDVDMGGVDISLDIDEVYTIVLVYLINGAKYLGNIGYRGPSGGGKQGEC